MCLATSENLGREKTDVTGLLVLAHDSKETGAPNTEDKGKSRGSIYRHRAQPLYVGNSVVSFCPWGLPWEQGSPYRFQVESCWALRDGVNQRWKEMGKELVGGGKTSLVCKNPKHGWGSQIQVVGWLTYPVWGRQWAEQKQTDVSGLWFWDGALGLIQGLSHPKTLGLFLAQKLLPPREERATLHQQEWILTTCIYWSLLMSKYVRYPGISLKQKGGKMSVSVPISMHRSYS